MKKVLAVTYGGGHVNAILPVLKKLQADSEIQLEVLGLTIAHEILEKAGVPAKKISHYYDPAEDGDVEALGKELLERFHVDGKGIDLHESTIYLGLAYRDLISDNGREEADRLLAEFGKKAFLQLGTARRLIEKEKPDLLLTGNCPRMERAATLAAREAGIPSINIHDYLAFEKRHRLEADRIAVMSDITKENLTRFGHDPERIVVTGQPAFDGMAEELANRDRGEICERLGLDPMGKFIVLGTQSPETTETMVRVCVDIIERRHPDHLLLVKPHPGEDSRNHRKLLDELGSNAALLPDAHIRDLIHISEFLVTFFSTIGFETALMRKPLLTLNFSGLENPVPLARFGLGIEATNEKEAEAAFGRILSDCSLREEFSRSLDMHFGAVLDGRGADRVTELAYELLDGGGAA